MQIDVPAVFAFGVLFADTAQKQIRAGSPTALRAQVLANLFHALCFAWAPTYFMVAYFGWETSHLWWHGDSAADHPWLLPGFLFVMSLVLNAGFLVGKWLVMRERQLTIWALYAVTAVYAVWWVWFTGERALRLGTYREFVAGQAPHVTEDPVFLFILVLSLVMTFAGLGFCGVRLWRDGLRLERPGGR